MKRQLTLLAFVLLIAVMAVSLFSCKPEEPHEHAFTATVTKAATCTDNGTMTYTCECGEDTYTKPITALGHAWGAGSVTKEPSCFAEGEMTYKCLFDGTHTTTEAIEKLAHTWDDGKVKTPATCETAGVMLHTCKVEGCGATEEKEIKALGHDYEVEITVEPGCETKGEKTYTCKNDPTHTYTEEIPAHDHTWNDGEITTPATCSAKGVKTFTCTVDGCGKTKTEDVDINADNHNYVGVVTTQPTCEAKGVKTFTCSHNSEHVYTEEVAAKGHAYDAGVVTTQPTCDDKGVKTFTCANDNTHTYTEELAALGHDYKSVVTNPTCTDDGYTTYTCANDATHTYVETDEGSAFGHAWEADADNTIAATCTTDGVAAEKCWCGATQQTTIPAGHVLDNTGLCSGCGNYIANVETTDTYSWIDLYTFTAPKAGWYVFDIPAGLGIFSQVGCEDTSWPPIYSPELDYNTSSNGGKVYVELEANEAYGYYVGASVKSSWTITISYSESNPTPVSLEGGYTASDNYGNSFNVIFTFNTITFTPPYNEEVIINYTCTAGGAITLYSPEGQVISNPGAASVILQDGTPVQLVYNMTTYNLTEGINIGGELIGETYSNDTYSVTFQQLPGGVVLLLTADETQYMYTFTATGTSEYYYELAIENADDNPYTGFDLAALSANGNVYISGTTNAMYIVIDDETVITLNDADNGSGEAEEGSESNPIVLESLPLNLEFIGNHEVYYSYTASEATTLIFVKDNAYISFSNFENYEYTDDGYIAFLTAGETITFSLWTNYVDDTTVCTYSITQSSAQKGDADLPASLTTYDTNTLDYPGSDENGYVNFTYNSYINGTLTLTFSGSVDVKYGTDLTNLTSVSAQTTVVIDITENGKYYVLVKGDSTVTFEGSALEAPGTQGNPIVLENWVGDHTCNIAFDEVWYSFTGGEEGGYVTISSNATISANAGSMYGMNYAENGSVQIYVKPGQTAYICVGNSEGTNPSFSISFVAGEHDPDGTYEYPYTAVMGDNTCSFEGGYSYKWYKITVSATGYITVSSELQNAKFVISSRTSSYTDDAIENISSVSYAAVAGTYYIGVMTSDDSAAEISFTVSFEEKELEPDGSAKLPYTAVVGDNTCAGGSSLVWYKITVDGACTITVSSNYVSATHNSFYHNTTGCAWIVIASEANEYADGKVDNLYGDGIGAAVVFTVSEAGTYYIGIADYCEASAEIVFNVAIATNSESPSEPEHTHSYTESITTTATCTEAGVKTFSCTCGYSYTETIEATGHVDTTTTTTDATCTVDGSTVVTCACGVTVSTTVIPAGHNIVDGKCSVCNEMTVYFKHSTTFNDVYAYIWVGDSVPVAWPGVKMTKGDDGWYSYTFTAPADTTGCKIIFNFGNNMPQTTDIEYVPGENYWVWENADSYATKEAAEAGTAAAITNGTLYLRGTMNGWGTTNLLSKDAYGNQFIEIELAANAEFKIADSSWGTACGHGNVVAINGAISSTGSDNAKVSAAGTYRITLTPSYKVIIEKIA